ncbi:MAG: zinc ribbon domain-containing protein [Peptococcaceae bacterium]|nr:zinc ribbon domain-containing protein [Peptococcaceae bacterium]
MPIFEYHCKNCGAVTEILQGVTIEEAPLQCSKCGGKELVKLISAHAGAKKRKGDEPQGSCCGSEKKEFADCIPGSCCGRYTIGE